MKMKTILFTLLTLSMVTSACKSKRNATKSAQENPKETLIAVLGKIPEKSDPLTIDTAYITGNILTLGLTYGGGCKDHTFQVIGSEMISKSLPPVRAVSLIHQANEDHCRAIVNKTIQVDISALAYKQEAGSEIFLGIDGYKEKLKYTFVR